MVCFKSKRIEKVLAAILCLMVVVSAFPITALASTTTYENKFTFTVKNQGSTGLEDAEVSYSIYVGDYDTKPDGAAYFTGTVTTDANGECSLVEVDSALETAMNDAYVDVATIFYTVTCDGYEVVSSSTKIEVSNFTDNVDVELEEETPAVPDTATVTVSGAGENATVTIDGTEQEQATVTIDSEVDVVIAPKAGYYIKSIEIDGESVEGFPATGENKFKSYEETLTITEDMVIAVVLAKAVTVTVADFNDDAGTVKLNDADYSVPLSLDKGDTVKLSVNANENYQISTIIINGTPIEVNGTEYEDDAITVNEDTTIEVSFVRLYTVEVEYDADTGELTTTPDHNAGKITVKEGHETISITVTPNSNYRVSAVKKTVGNEESDYTFEDNGHVYTDTISNIDKDYKYIITFLPNRFDVTTEINNNTYGTATVSAKVDYNGSTNVEISPKAGYGVSVVKVNSVEIDYTKLSYNEEENKYTYSLEGVTENTTISIEFAEIEKSAYQSPDVTDNFGDALNVIENDDYIEYVFKKGQTVELNTDKSGIRINGYKFGDVNRFTTPEWSTQKTTEITKIEIYSSEWDRENFKVKGWSEVELTKPIKITFDETTDGEEAVALSVPELNGYTVYNSDVNVTVNAKDSLSGIKSIDYFVTDEKIEAGKGYDDVDNEAKAESGNLYTYNDGDAVETLLTKDILVSAEGEYVTVWVKLTDNANNSTFEKIEFSVDKTAPEVSVSIDGTPATTTTAGQGYYNQARTATITVIEPQGYSFNPTGLVIEITKSKKGETTETKQSIGSTAENWEVYEDDKTKHTYKIEFEPDYTYTWELTSYSSNATKVESAQIEVDEESKTVWNFTVDNQKPTGELSYNFIDVVWKTILEEITFGYFTNDKVTCSVNAKDEHSDIASIEYYKLVAGSELYNDILSDGKISEADVEKMSFAEYPENKFEITEEERFNVFAKITDLAGNVTYIGADGVIIDKTELNIDIAPDSTNGTGYYYNANFEVNVNVAEQGRKDIQSGIKSIDYKICVDGEEKVKENIYTKDKSIDYSCEKDIEVSAENCNGNDVKFIVTAVDNAGNEFEKTVTLAPIDTVFRDNDITVTFDGDTGLREDYYTDLKATIEIKEKNFDSENVQVLIGATDAAGETIDGSYTISQWTSNPNGDIHTATVTFNKDADYTFAIEATDKAGNDASFKEVKFTVDKTVPTGSVIVEGSVWEQIGDIIRFEFGNTSRKVTAENVKDTTTKTENIKIEYYISDEDVFLTDKALKDKEWKPFPDEGITKDPDSQFVVYLKLTDKVGNYSFIYSNGHILDEKVSEVKFETSASAGTDDQEHSLYNGNVSVTAKVTDIINDQDASSGIKEISAVVTKDGKETENFKPYMFEGETTKENIQLSLSKDYNFVVDAEKNNSCNVIAHVTVEDNAGNVETYDLPLDIDITPPKVVVDFSDTKKDDAKENCFTSRTATVTITERTHHFNAQKATDSIKITAENAKGEAVSNAYEISTWTTTEGKTPDEDTHTATITFREDANYTFDIEYQDLAGNKADDYEKQIFTVDTKVPTGSINIISKEGREATWNELVTGLTFGFWSKEKITISATSSDVTSKDIKVEYFVDYAKEPGSLTLKTKDDLEAVNNDTWKEFEKAFDVVANNEFIVYLKLTDNSGNIEFISTNGLIVDDQHPDIESVAPEVTAEPVESPLNGIYKGDVKVAIKVVDPTVGGTYSGLNKVTYKVINNALVDEKGNKKVTQSGDLFVFDGENPTQKELTNEFETTIVVDSKLNNSNDVQIIVYAVDNAGNGIDNSQTDSQGYTNIKLDITAPTIDIAYDNNAVDSNKYFAKNRTATITLTERNFKANDVEIVVTRDGEKVVTNPTWTMIAGTSENLDDTKYVAKIPYTKDGDYKFSIAYTDLAGNKCTSIKYADGTIASNDFTIDKTKPVVKVTYDNNDVKNGNYYKAERTATIQITEHNFNTKRVNAVIGATDDGATTKVPVLSKWNSQGDVHTATVYYPGDARYTFDIDYTDLAGNKADDYKGDTFYVDKTKPTLKITNVSNDAAYAGSVAPVVSYSDTNIDKETVKITLRGANRGEVKANGTKADAKNGEVFTFANFENIKSVDDIYTLTATLTDRAGNTSTETVRFSVNRFGSTYELSKSLQKYNGAYVQTVDDIVITEVNANRLENIKLTLFKNSETIILKENTDYKVTVNGGGGSWYSYTYTVFKSVFSDDGIYRLSIHSEDAAGNVAENTLDTKDKEISFGIDTTLPNIVVANLKQGETYPEAQKEVKLSVNDNMIIETLTVYFDDSETPFASWTAKEIADIVAENGEFKFVIPGDNGEEHKVRIVCVDAAGNTQEQIIDDFYVTTNKFVQFYNNKALFFGSIGGGVAVIALVVFFVVKKRKSK